jgi:hypothetical protein
MHGMRRVSAAHCAGPVREIRMRPRRRPAPRSPARQARPIRSTGSARSIDARCEAARPWLDRLSVFAFAVLWACAAAKLHVTWLSPDLLPVLAAGALAGYLLADLVAGGVHWIADRHFDPRTPVVGPLLIAPFRAHHEDPLSITRHDLFEVLGNNALVTLPAVTALLFVPLPGSAVSVFLVALGLVGTFAAVATNLFHAWAHAPNPPRLAAWLQRHHLVLTPREHARHHRAPYDEAYCVTSGWLNPLLDRTRLFARLDAAIARATRTHRTDAR